MLALENIKNWAICECVGNIEKDFSFYDFWIKNLRLIENEEFILKLI